MLWRFQQQDRHPHICTASNISSHDQRFEAENACRCPNFFHMTMTWKRLGFYRHKSGWGQLVYITFDGAVIAMQSPPAMTVIEPGSPCRVPKRAPSPHFESPPCRSVYPRIA